MGDQYQGDWHSSLCWKKEFRVYTFSLRNSGTSYSNVTRVKQTSFPRFCISLGLVLLKLRTLDIEC